MESDGKINAKPDKEKAFDPGNPDQLRSDHEFAKNQNEEFQMNPVQEPANDHSELVQMLLNAWKKIYTNTLLRKALWRILFITLIISIVLFIFAWFLYIVPSLQEIWKSKELRQENVSELKSDALYRKQMTQLVKDEQRLSRKFSAYTSGQSYLVINTTGNRFFLYQNKKLVREGFCSTGSYTQLTNAEGSKQWIFKTPKGRFWIHEKITSPLWVRPDWSFVEEGLPIPPANDESRYENGVLGDYAMSLGDGYLIHGTIYKRFLGMPVTHGCVRLNDDDLETIYNTLNIGSKVYIF